MIEVSELGMKQGDFKLERVNFKVDSGSYAVLMGPTGCGKTSLLEAICGLRKIQSGNIFINGANVTRLAAAQREIGYVPQEAVLFPSMRVDKQIDFALRVRNVSRSERRDRVDELGHLLKIQTLFDRRLQGLSGGEKQRIALARALSFRPSLLCLDEPLSALDEDTREEMAQLLKTVHENEQVTVLHVTHSSKESETLGDVQLRFDRGKIYQL